MSTIIEDVNARIVLNSRGEETIEVDVVTTSSLGRASAPAGRSRGRAEVIYYPEGGVDQAVIKVKEHIAPRMIGLNVDFQETIDEKLHEIDCTQDFSVIGGNTAFAISLASTEAAANSYRLPLFHYLGGYLANELPYPLGNVISGGKHGIGKTPEFQEFLVLPLKSNSFFEAAIANTLIHKKTGRKLDNQKYFFSGGRSDEGAWIANIGNLDALEIMTEACEEVANEQGVKCGLGIDIAASSLWDPKEEKYVYPQEGRKRDTGEQLEFVHELIEKYHLVYVEDPFYEEDYRSSAELTEAVENCLICGDDLFVTNAERLSHGKKMNAANAVIIKVNQVGTLSDAWKAINMAKGARYTPVISHRSGDTCDWHIAHLAVAFGCPMIKTGIVEGTRIAKINELLRIEEQLGGRAKMADLPSLRR
ncbi:MAG: enolase C-terminal domain-like protein [Candidatus Bathyarchaeota archaeon]